MISSITAEDVAIQGFALSEQQRRLWRWHLSPEPACGRCVVHLEGELDRPALRRALETVVRRHEILRTAFRSLAGLVLPLQVIEDAAPVSLEEVSLGGFEAAGPEALSEELLAVFRPTFALADGDVLRAALGSLSPREHLLLLALPALCADAETLRNLIAEICRAYAAQRGGPRLEGEPPQYADVAEWQSHLWSSETTSGGVHLWREHWRKRRVSELLTVRLPLADSFNEGGRFAPDSLPVPYGPGLAASIEEVARVRGCTPRSFLIACWNIVLGATTGQPETLVGVLHNGRAYEELAEAFGPLSVYLPVSCPLPETATPAEIALRLQADLTEAAGRQEHFSWEHLDGGGSFFPFCFSEEELGEHTAGGLRCSVRHVDAVTDRFQVELVSRFQPGHLRLRLRYDPASVPREVASLLAARLSALLHSAIARPDAPLSELDLLGERELRHLVELNPPAAETPGARLDELFERQAGLTPDRLAVVDQNERLTYAELEARANRLAHHLRDLGVLPESLVGICLERSAEAVTAILAVLKSGGAYVPLDPKAPTERRSGLLRDLGAPIVITRTGLLDVFPEGTRLLRLDAEAERIAGRLAVPPSRAGAPGNLAYTIFTSGSTGRPKGVLVEHGSPVHLLAALTASVLPREPLRATLNAPLVFDASMQQLLLLLAGHTLHLVPEEVRTDGAALLDLLRSWEVELFDCTPSHLRLLLAAGMLEAPDPVPAVVLVAGEPIDPALWETLRGSQRTVFFNIYGPTEATVDATAHRIGAASPDAPTIGRPLAGYEVFLVDPAFRLVPLGAPGEICLGGPGLARGYLDQPGVTAEKFVPHPFGGQPGARLYRTGDLARYRLNGQLEFLGRIDHQVKIRGNRVELGEIEAALTAHPRVREAVVVVREDHGGKRLFAYVVPRSRDERPAASDLRYHLEERLPDYMVPAGFVSLDFLPLTPSGKFDRRALPEPSLQVTEEVPFLPPRTPAEQALATIWAEVLRAERVGVHDNFFSLGGDSILSIQICARAQKAGLRINPRLLFKHQTVAELAAVADTAGAAEAEQGLVTGPVPLTPIQRQFFAGEPAEPHHYNQAVLFETLRPLHPALLQTALSHLERHHDALRLRFERGPDEWRQAGAPPGATLALAVADLAALPAPARTQAIEAAAAQAQASLDLQRGPLYRALLLDSGPAEPGRFLWAIHHLAVDGVSWRVLLEDLASLYEALAQGQSASLPAKTSSFRLWAERLAAHAGAPETEAELSYWLSQPWTTAGRLPLDRPEGLEANTVASQSTVSLLLDPEETRTLLQEVPQAYNTQINDALLTALARGFQDWTGSPTLLVDLEGHGREEIFDDVDLSRTVGWFTSVYPVLLDLREAPGPGGSLKAVKEHLRRVPRGGIGYGLLRWSGDPVSPLTALPRPAVLFNYLGQLDQALPAGSPFRPARESAGSLVSPRAARRYLFEINGGVFGGRLGFTCSFSTSLHRRETVQRLIDAVAARLREIIAHCRAADAAGYTPSDFPLAALGQDRLDALVAAQAAKALPGVRRAIEDVYPLSPMQQGILFHTQYASDSGIYLSQTSFQIGGGFDPAAFKRALARAIERHAVLRTAFVSTGLDEPVQVVHRAVALPLREEDWSGLPEAERRQRLEDYLAADSVHRFDLEQPPLLRFLLARETKDTFRLVWSVHLLLIDGWSTARLIGEIFACYEAFRQRLEPRLDPPGRFRDYIAWLAGQDAGQAEAFWRKELAGLRNPTPLPGDRGSGRAAVVAQSRILLDEETTEALQAFARISQLTVSTLLQGAWALLLSRLSGERDVVFGVTVSGRPAELPGAESMVGHFINSLPLRVETPPEELLRPWLRQLQDRHSEARQLGHVPLVEIQGWSGLPRGVPLFDSLLVFENYPVDAAAREGGTSLTINEFRAREVTNYPLVLVGYPGRRLALVLASDRSRFAADAASRLLGYLSRLLEEMVRKPEGRLNDLDYLPSWERHQLLVEWNDTGADVPAGLCIHHLVEAQAGRAPEAVALVSADVRLTYRELDTRANRLAHHLRALGVGPDVLVGLCAERSPEMVVGMLGILKAGGAYVPFNPEHPRERLAYVARDSGISVLLAQRHLADLLPAVEARVAFLEEEAAASDRRPVASGLSSGDLAYVLYTSGSTGRPKGVQVSHACVINFLVSMERAPGLTASDALLAVTPLSFDIAALEIFLPLMVGARIEIAPHEAVVDGERLAALLGSGLTTMQATPATWRMLLETGWTGRPDLKILCGGEAWPRELADRLLVASGSLWNLYGPTETTIWSALERIVAGPEPIAIGRPLANTRIHLLSPDLEPVPAGIPGELYIGGAGLARGYLGRPDLTAERFVCDPFAGLAREPGARLYRTGDLVRRLPDGRIEYLGRIDHQVKIRGVRIELGEIETALLAHPEVREAVVVAHEGTDAGARRLVAYIVGTGGQTANELRGFLQERLPEVMIPAAFVALDALPLNANGKLDRSALPAPGVEASSGGSDARFRTPVEEMVAEIWADLLGHEAIEPQSDFFALGGHSFLATRAISRLRNLFGIDLPVRALFDAPTVQGLAAEIERVLRSGGWPELPPLRRVPRDQALPLSFAQQRLWFLQQLEPESAAYNLPLALRLVGRLDVSALCHALDSVVARHETLRTTFHEAGGEPFQRIETAGPQPLLLIDLSALPPAILSAEERRLAAEEAATPFDLACLPVVRLRLLRLAAEEHALLLTLHHVSSDAWSLGLLTREVTELYAAAVAGRAPRLPELPVQYADFAAWQRGWLQGEVLASQIDYWRRQLAGAPLVLDLPTDHPRPPVQLHRARSQSLFLPSEALAAARALSRSTGATLFMALLAIHAATLQRFAGQETLTVGTPIANRNRTELEGLIGFFVNTLALRVDLGDDPGLRPLVLRVRETALGAYAHQDLPFERLVEELQPQRDRSRAPLVQAMFVFQTAGTETLRLPDLELLPFGASTPTIRHDLALTCTAHDDGLAVTVDYDADLFDPATMERLLQLFANLLSQGTAAPEAPVTLLPLLGENERLPALAVAAEESARLPEASGLHQLFEAQAARAPEAPAVLFEGGILSYGELDRLANRLARRLRRMGVGTESRVGLLFERSPEALAALLAILKAGGAYVPLDPESPPERRAAIAADAGLAALVVQAGLTSGVPDRPTLEVDRDGRSLAVESAAPLDSPPLPDAAAYVIYTSGSTGEPKGVVLAHRGAVGLVRSLAGTLGIGPEDRLFLFAPLAFDASVLQIFCALGTGASLAVHRHPRQLSSHEILDFCARQGVTVLDLPAALWRQWVEEVASGGLAMPGSLRTFLTGGESVPVARLRQWAGLFAGSPVSFLSSYGPTEATVTAMVFLSGSEQALNSIEPDGSHLPLGRALPGVRVHLVDRRGREVPARVPGELWLGGPGLARGYLGRPALTAEAFVPDPLGEEPGARLYRTGDLARRRPGGELEFLGRADHQVKIRGVRIELGEIEAALTRHSAVRQAVLALREDRPGDRRLAAYVVVEESVPGIPEEELRRWLAERLPESMIPSSFIPLASLPVLPSGKVDRQALPAPKPARLHPAAGPAGLRTPVEQVLAAIWEETLGVEHVGASDNFFALGGHSLLATQVVSRLRSALGVEMPLRELFEAPALADLAARVEEVRQADLGREARPLVPVSRLGPLPLSFAQQRLWFIDQLEPGLSLYNMPVTLRIEGELDAAVLALCLGEIVRRHEVLRTVFASAGGPPVQVIRPAGPPDLAVVDLSGLPGSGREAIARALANEEAGRPFDLARGPLLRSVLLRLAESDHIAVLTLHHIVSDGWSMGVLIREVEALYRAFREGRPSPLLDLPIQYADFAAWQLEWLDREALDGLAEHWRRRLAGAPPQLELPGARPRPAMLSPRGARRQRRFSAPLLEQLRALGRRESATLFMTLLAPLQALFHSLNGATDLVVGTDVAGRDRRETEGLIGFFINQLPLRADLSGDPTLRELLGRVRETALDAYAHQDLPFDHLVEALRIERSLQRSPVFQVKLVLQNANQETLELPGLTLKVLPSSMETAQLDLHWSVAEMSGELWVTLTYSTDLYDEPLIESLLDRYEMWLRVFSERPEARLGEVVAELAQAVRARRTERGRELKAVGLGKLQSLRRQAEEATEI